MVRFDGRSSCRKDFLRGSRVLWSGLHRHLSWSAKRTRKRSSSGARRCPQTLLTCEGNKRQMMCQVTTSGVALITTFGVALMVGIAQERSKRRDKTRSAAVNTVLGVLLVPRQNSNQHRKRFQRVCPTRSQSTQERSEIKHVCTTKFNVSSNRGVVKISIY